MRTVTTMAAILTVDHAPNDCGTGEATPHAGQVVSRGQDNWFRRPDGGQYWSLRSFTCENYGKVRLNSTAKVLCRYFGGRASRSRSRHQVSARPRLPLFQASTVGPGGFGSCSSLLTNRPSIKCSAANQFAR